MRDYKNMNYRELQEYCSTIKFELNARLGFKEQVDMCLGLKVELHGKGYEKTHTYPKYYLNLRGKKQYLIDWIDSCINVSCKNGYYNLIQW